jgi:hypothetical protein
MIETKHENISFQLDSHDQQLCGVVPVMSRMGTGSFPGVKRPGRGVDHLPTSSVEVKERVELRIYSPSGPHGVF